MDVVNNILLAFPDIHAKRKFSSQECKFQHELGAQLQISVDIPLYVEITIRIIWWPV